MSCQPLCEHVSHSSNGVRVYLNDSLDFICFKSAKIQSEGSKYSNTYHYLSEHMYVFLMRLFIFSEFKIFLSLLFLFSD